MSIIADENMAALAPLFADYGDIKTFPGRDIDPHHVDDSTKVMLLRSVTKVDAALLDAAPNLEFIGTATIGTDHFDIPQIEERRVRWSNAPGCNAQGVGEYVLSSLLLLAQRSDEDLQTKTIGIVGLGNTGTAVARRLRALGYTIMCCDPPRQQRGDAGQWYSLEQIIAQCDVITLHVPLSSDTFYLLDNQRLSQLQANCWLINASRGEVIDNRALINYKQQQPTLRLVLDVWENEPTPMMELVALAEIATPHIAGYSVEGKIRGSQMLHQALYQGKQTTPTLAELIDVEPLPVVTAPAQLEQQWLAQICATVYDIAQEDLRFRSALPTGFDARRKANLARREFSAQRIIGAPAGMATTLSELGFTI
ncbi:4-phosphoerythronate dehydrogenase [Ferrimonas lipolytica]|uniref:Erythronate-4-phosphate dehydrogenase n=1 Tax=Ferrimonas lipolytica TaxID=2724191 RepID=A0A6H1UHB2_9GAMM|nr:4-phosphoerythronate dehydrogenase [Ferrimonas lipolytica]QIZ77182.1 4-phosphoerythronate dehydrogenase [Ferrimonas lipolytica]